MMSRFKPAAAFFSLLALLILSSVPAAWAYQVEADQAGQDASGLEVVTLQLKWYHQFQFAGYYAALEQGYYEDAGLHVVIEEGHPEQTSIDAVMEGEADYGVAGPEVLLHYMSGKPLVSLAPVFQHSPAVILVLEDSGIMSPQDLIGRRMMNYEGYSSAEYTAVLLSEGVDLDKVEMIDISFDINELVEGKVDSYTAYSTNEPFYLEQLGVKTRQFRPLTYGIDFYGDTLFTSRQEATRRPSRARAFRDASIKGWQYAMNNPAEIIDLLLTEYDCQKSREQLAYEAEEMRQLIVPHLVQVGHTNPLRWKRIADIYISLGMVDRCPPLDSFLLVDRPAQNPYLKVIAIFAAVAAVIGLLLTLMLLSFNQRLRAAVRIRTQELDRTNRRLQDDIEQRRSIEKALRASEQNLSNIFDNALIGIAVMDLTGKFTQVNPRFAAMLKRNQLEMIGQNYFDLIDLRDTRQAGSNLELLVDGDVQRISVERLFSCADGTCLTCQVYCRLLLDDEGQPNEILNIITDVTERKQVEGQLRESEAFNRAIIENSPLGISVRNRHGQLLSCNESWKKIWGHTEESIKEAMERPRSSLVFDKRDSYLGRWLPAVRDVYTRGGTLSVPHVKTNSVRLRAAKWVSQYYYAILGENGEVDRVVILTDDITERMMAEEALRESEQRLAKAQEIAHVGNWEYNIASGKVTWSDEMYRIIGFRPGQIIPSNELVKDLIHPDNREQHLDLFQRLQDNDGKLDWEYKVRHVNGTYRHIFDRVSYIYDAHGKPDRIMGIAQDISELKEAEKELRKSREHLHQAQKMEAIGVLAGGIAHDFNNILLAILGNADMLLTDLGEDGQSAQFVKEIITAGNRAAELVRQILSFSRQSEQHQESVRVAKVVTEVVKLVRSTLPSTIGIESNIKAHTVTINADSTQLHQVLLNLCANAGHAMLQTGGTLRIGLDTVDVDKEFCAKNPLLKPGHHVVMTIADNGPGIEEGILEHIFEPFFTTKAVGEGTGMGLAVVHGIVLSLDGMINVSSTVAEGTTFTIHLPAAQAGFEVQKPAAEVPVGGQESILYIDDEEPIVRMAERLLAKLGYRVTTAVSSREALELFREDPQAFDLVITDQTMPNLTGAEMAQQMLDIRPDLPIILCTGYSYVINDEDAKQIGIREYMTKPFTRKSLDTAIRKVFGT